MKDVTPSTYTRYTVLLPLAETEKTAVSSRMKGKYQITQGKTDSTTFTKALALVVIF